MFTIPEVGTEMRSREYVQVFQLPGLKEEVMQEIEIVNQLMLAYKLREKRRTASILIGF